MDSDLPASSMNSPSFSASEREEGRGGKGDRKEEKEGYKG